MGAVCTTRATPPERGAQDAMVEDVRRRIGPHHKISDRRIRAQLRRDAYDVQKTADRLKPAPISVSVGPPPTTWTTHLDARTGRRFYFNQADPSGQSVWGLPAGVIADNHIIDEDVEALADHLATLGTSGRGQSAAAEEAARVMANLDDSLFARLAAVQSRRDTAASYRSVAPAIGQVYPELRVLQLPLDGQRSARYRTEDGGDPGSEACSDVCVCVAIALLANARGQGMLSLRSAPSLPSGSIETLRDCVQTAMAEGVRSFSSQADHCMHFVEQSLQAARSCGVQGAGDVVKAGADLLFNVPVPVEGAHVLSRETWVELMRSAAGNLREAGPLCAVLVAERSAWSVLLCLYDGGVVYVDPHGDGNEAVLAAIPGPLIDALGAVTIAMEKTSSRPFGGSEDATLSPRIWFHPDAGQLDVVLLRRRS